VIVSPLPEKVVHQWTAEEFNEAITTRGDVVGCIWELKQENIHIIGTLPKGEPVLWPSQQVSMMRRMQNATEPEVKAEHSI
jgi:hypothetical protein